MNSQQQIILMVEDDPFDTKLIRRAMNKARILNPVHHLPDGEAAIAYLAGKHPYENRNVHPLPVLLLLDLKLPIRNGFEVLKWLQTQPGLARIPVVVLTSSNESPDISRAYDLGANSYLVKPVESEALVNLLKTVEMYWLMTNTSPDLESDPIDGSLTQHD